MTTLTLIQKRAQALQWRALRPRSLHFLQPGAAARQLKLNLLDQVKMHIDEPEAVKALDDAKWFTQPGG